MKLGNFTAMVIGTATGTSVGETWESMIASAAATILVLLANAAIAALRAWARASKIGPGKGDLGEPLESQEEK